MLFKSQIMTQASGSIGGTTFSHNKGGMYQRARSIPVNPSTAAQQFVRNTLSTLNAVWSVLLDDSQRLAFSNYAVNNPITGKLGDPLQLSGQQMFIRLMATRSRAGLAVLSTAPSIDSLVTLTQPVATPTAAASTVSVAFTAGDAWNIEDGGALLVFGSRKRGSQINYFKGPYQYFGSILGSTGAPLTSPQNVTSAFGDTYATGDLVFLRYVAVRADGRISATLYQRAVAA